MRDAKLTIHLPWVFALLVVSFAVYANVLDGEFIWDDHLQVVRNSSIRTLENIPRAFTTSLWSFMYSKEHGEENRVFDQYYRPFQTVIYILAYRLGGLSPFVFHVINVTLHCAATLLVYLLCLELGLPAIISFMAGAIFAVHPVHTEAVSWIAGVGDLSCALFYFGGLLAFLRYLRSRKAGWLCTSAVCFLAALFSKEMAVTFPLVAFFLSWTLPKKQRPGLKDAVVIASSFGVVVVVYAIFRIIAIGLTPTTVVHEAAGIFDWATLGLWVVGQYFRYVVAPYPLYVYHLVPLHFSDRVLSTALYGIELSAIFALCWYFRRRLPAAWLWVAIFAITLIPVLYFKGISGAVFFAERYLYIPSMAMAILAGFFLARLSRPRAILAASCLVVVFAVLTIQRNRDWRNEENLYQRTVQFQPETVNMWTSLAEIYLRRKDNTRAQEYFQTALQHTNDRRFVMSAYENYRIYLGLGTVAARQEMPIQAVEHLQKAISFYPQGDGAYTQLAGVLINWGHNYKDAIVLLEKAMQLSAVSELARDYMGVALFNQGRHDEAIKYFREALQLDPELESAKQHLEAALKAKNQP